MICSNFALVKAVPSRKMKKGPGEVPRSHKCSHRRHRAEEVASPAHDHLGSPAELVRLRVVEIDSDGLWVFQVVDRHIAPG